VKAKSNPTVCPHCLSLVSETINTFVYFDCTTNINISTQITDRSKVCVKREKILGQKLIEFLKKKK
jgi:hypothetical protein